MVLGKYLLLDTSRNIDNTEYTFLFQFLQIHRHLTSIVFLLQMRSGVGFSILKDNLDHLLNMK